MLLNKTSSEPLRTKAEDLSAFETSRALAQQALDLVDKYLTPPKPKTYEVLYTYASGNDRSINECIDSIIGSSGGLNNYDIEQVYNDYFGNDEKQRRQNDKTNTILKREIDSIIDVIKAHRFSNKEYAGSLDATLKNLRVDISPGELKTTVELLIAENRRMQTEALELTDMLEQSRVQMQKMGEELAEARKTALLDPVTGIGNRSWLSYKLETELKNAERSSRNFCLIFIDIDHFKRINDQFGHAAGDQVLRFFGTLLSNQVDDKDQCARYGGEEFVIILPDMNIEGAEAFAEKIRQKLESSKLIFTTSKQPLGRITASFGITKSRSDDDVKSILVRADKQLYKAKNAGRNCTVCEG